MENLEHKERVEELAGMGATAEDIAAELRISVEDLRERYREALAYGSAKGRNDILTTLYQQVQSGTSSSALSLWVKAVADGATTVARAVPLFTSR
jgi:orotate phosphoribosyltransferase-like protein